jgi:hypothetical protein
MKMTRPLYIGFEFERVENWKNCVEVPTAPKNYKDKDKIAEYIDSRYAELSRTAETGILTSRLRTACTLTDDGEAKKMTTAAALMHYLREHPEFTDIIAIDTLSNLRRCAWGAVAEGKSDVVPAWAWHMNTDRGYTEGPNIVNLWRMSGAKAAGVSAQQWLSQWLQGTVDSNPKHIALALRKIFTEIMHLQPKPAAVLGDVNA